MAKVNVILDFTKKDIEEEIYSPSKEVLDLNKLLKIHQMLQGLEIITGGIAGADNNISHHNS